MAAKTSKSLQKRAEEKQRSRDEDARRLFAGEATAETLRVENSFFNLSSGIHVDFGEAPEAYGKRAVTGLDDLAAKLKAGTSYEDLQDEIDALLGTDMAPRDKAAEALWERNRRK